MLDKPAQLIDGIGGAFSEKGWQALSALSPTLRQQAMEALFLPAGANFSLCRSPIGGNDIAKDFYSYDEVDGDFALQHFSVEPDSKTLIPFIHAAQAIRPDLRLWASPWSPPLWMKTNKHYAQGPAWAGMSPNGIRPEQIVKSGEDGFIQEDRYFDVYARYFRRYIETYRELGIRVDRVMPQNEFNSSHPFPSCCWSAKGLARFIPHLHREMQPLGVDIVLGTLERSRADIVSAIVNDPVAGVLIKGVGVQWAGKGALEKIREEHPQLTIWSSEQECGNCSNDWHYARYG
ncbi:glycoside hydrolase family 30 protein [Roseateles cellulosilyticus]|uniref:Glycosyl hydrolase family 30 TIM-barrel domain-containing protein n=1 Tax=Pelomonas cellulosilytica TaxID=2906762 RepID=A0ABS8XM33_9BURK|nr:hypothetical protein [Pelomonas sp. P8]MCE4552863.1 hypothetical protein [Pelomonas sp. P8]